MFNGIVECTGVITHNNSSRDCLELAIQPQLAFSDLKTGDSVAVNGVCLTVTEHDAQQFRVTVVPETMRRSNLGMLETGSAVNLERSLRAGDRISGHFVQGHIDSMGEITDVRQDGGNALLVKISMPSALQKYIVAKGYIGLDGMSITVIETGDDWFTVTFIPHTRDVTIVKSYRPGMKINIEVDIMGKYIEKILRG
jgi:riboflavin synthase